MFKISKSKISLNNTPKIIAEISANHNQDLNKAIRLIKKASQYGADFVKIQTYSPENLTLNSNKKDFIINNPQKDLYESYLDPAQGIEAIANLYYAGDIKKAKNIDKFIDSKKIISVLLIPVMIVLFTIGLYNWYSIGISTNFASSFYYVNEVFYNTFFSILIIADVFILLLSFLYTERYSQIMRNTGFIICTILIRLSFSSTGLTNLLLIISSVLFGLLILKIYSLMNKIE